MDKISIVIPCYNEEESIRSLIQQLNLLQTKMDYVNFEFLFVDDGSNDKTLQIIQEFNHLKYISFSRNFGKEAAMYAGLKTATGNYVTVIDADGQDPLYLLPEMYRLITVDKYDYITVCRTSRDSEPFLKKTGAKIFYKLFSYAQENERDMKLMNRRVLNAILQYGEYNRYFKGISNSVGFNKATLYAEDAIRVQGQSKFPLKKCLSLGLDSLINFEKDIYILPLIIMCIGLIITFISLFINISMFIICLCFSGLFGILSIIVLYLSRIYLEVKHRPHFIIKQSNL